MLRNCLINSLLQISDILEVTHKLPEDQATEFYVGTNAGKHVRHVLDHVLTFIPSIKTGTLDYNRRNRDSDVETNWQAAQTQLKDILKTLKTLDINDKALEVISEIDTCSTENDTFTSNVPREVLYLINHTMHHAAYIKLLAKNCGVDLPDNIGIAPATASHIRKMG